MFEDSDLMPLLLPVAMIVFGNASLFTCFKVWFQIILINSFMFGLVGLNAGHHHPDIVHEGDKIRFVSL